MPTKPDTLAPPDAETLISIRDLEVHFDLRGGTLDRLLGRDTGKVRAVDGCSIDLRRGEVLGVVGESGSGKTTLGRALLGLAPATGGSIQYDGRDIATMSERELREIRRELQMVFQDPHASLNPSMTIEESVGHPLRIHRLADRQETHNRVIDALEQVGLSPVERFLTKYPSDLSGGQKQRAVIARAIIMGPSLLVADEPISMLDMSVRAKILQLMLDLKQDLDLTYVYITHDLASAKFFCDRIAIMYLGRIVELGPTEEIFRDPKHPYTQALMGAIPEPDPEKSVPRDLPRGEIPDAAEPPLGCSFHPRCPKAFDRCGWESRDLVDVLEEHWISLGGDDYDQERQLIANLDELDAVGVHSKEGVLRPGSGRSAEEVRTLVDRLREEQRDEPFWRGVSTVSTESDGVHIEFHEGEDPGLRRAGEAEVACLLYEDAG